MQSRRFLKFLVVVFMGLTRLAHADGERAGEFDYYVLSLSWSPNWCVLEGDARNSPQCEDGSGHGWILHGLWPQYERGWPGYCPTNHRNPSRSDTAEMADIMGTSGLAWHQWNKHGRCSGLSSDDYYALSRDAYGQVTRPSVFRRLDDAVRLPARVVEEAFLKENRALEPDMLTVTCRDNMIQEVRICLTPEMEPRTCGQEVIRDCHAERALFEVLR
ncbi:ribonuclease T2 family protein [Halocynthiibacter namhaensis]|uniref:ribonuclease T2 family protein n=1 Tax=Halocynthiibacter namhaensis TaxID=1290553 RepID=UPI0005797FD5|nr:ribonuclease T2 [Halocynthiibacter namhaensis]